MIKKANYVEMGFGRSMGPMLKKLVEGQLTKDLEHYGVINPQLRFDWSESCIEGKCTKFLDGSIDRFSSIYVFDNSDKLIAYGWMEFIHEGDFFWVYWDMVKIYRNEKIIFDKKFGLPDHIWEKIPDEIKHNYIDERQKSGFSG